MLDEYEFYQGVVIRQLVVAAQGSITIRPYVRQGRISAFVLNGRLGVYVKHSAKRMRPWRFTFNIEQAADLLDLEAKFPLTFAVFVCETDGLVALDIATLHQIVGFAESDHGWLRIDRPPRAQYEVGGNRDELPHKLSRGIAPILEALNSRLGRVE